jgi:hypothetical protein
MMKSLPIRIAAAKSLKNNDDPDGRRQRDGIVRHSCLAPPALVTQPGLEEAASTLHDCR